MSMPGEDTWSGMRPALKTFIDGRADIFIFNGVFDDFLKATGIKRSVRDPG